ncbi:MAG TPA: hypothetical protein DIT64_05040 [Verrucomicrobiales bacterium]|nr:hypothetical protein [Verrucomicrobiales bacterium]
MLALLELVIAVYQACTATFHMGVALRWMLSSRYRAEIRKDQEAQAKVGFGFVFLALLLTVIALLFVF